VTWRDGGQNSEITSDENESVAVRLSRRYPVSDGSLIAVDFSRKGNCGQREDNRILIEGIIVPVHAMTTHGGM